MKPSISYTNPFTTPEWIDSSSPPLQDSPKTTMAA
jgi:hypothetical protein